MKTSKNLFASLIIAITCAFASPAFADGDSWTNGSVGAGTSVVNGMGGFDAGYQGSAGTQSWNNWWNTGVTQVSVAGAVNGYVTGQNGTSMGHANSGANAQEGGWSTNVSSGASSGSSASVWNGMASSSANAGAGGSAQSGGWWW